MIAPLTMFAVLQQGQRIQTPVGSSGQWYRVAPTDRPPNSWGAITNKVDLTFDYLKKDSSEGRFAKMKKYSYLIATNHGDQQVVYIHIASKYLNTFRSEARSNQISGPLSTEIINGEGVTYFPFVLDCYKACSLATNAQSWGSLGRTLLKKYPKDHQLEEAFVYDGMYGAMSEDDLLLAKKINNNYFKEKSAETILRRNTNLTYKLFQRTKRDAYSKETISLCTELKKVTSDRETIELCDSIIQELQSE